MTLEIYTASAGTGKTTKLAELMENALLGQGVPACRPEGILATTFTRKAAAELRERTRTHLLSHRHIQEAQALNAAMIGTVNGVCGRIVSDFALELGLSPELRVLDENDAAIALAHCLSMHEHTAASRELDKLSRTLQALKDHQSVLHWQNGVRQIVQLARLNGLDAKGIEDSRDKSLASLFALLGPPAADGASLDSGLHDALDAFDQAIDPEVHTLKKTAEALNQVRDAASMFERDGRPAWSVWASLAQLDAGKDLRETADIVKQAAAKHDVHPEMRRELSRAVELVFSVAARALDDYADYKRTRGVIDYVDQEVLALEALEHPTIREEMRHRLDIVMVDEFQDTSPLQLAIFLKLFELAPRSIWVGDPKQAIYSFRGTDPALMSAAIEQLEEGHDDGDAEFVQRTMAELTRRAKVSVLEHSWRSRPPLVNLTSELFARAFEPQGIPPERTKITAHDPKDPPQLGPSVEYWALNIEHHGRTKDLSHALADGVRSALADVSVQVRDRVSGKPRALRPADIGILCRSNTQCQSAAAALTAVGVPVQVSAKGLLRTLESTAMVAALNLWRAPQVPLFKAQLSRIMGDHVDPQAWTNAALDEPYGKAFDTEAAIVAVLHARNAHPDADPVTTVDKVMEATGVRERCLEWGNSAQRLANLDLLRCHAVAYTQAAGARGDASTIAGLLYELKALADAEQDACALLGQGNAVAISTWHAAKGLEWPMVVLFGLEKKPDRPTRYYGARVETPPGTIDLKAPLAGRWIRYWCTPYLGANTKTPFYERLKAHPLAQNTDQQQDREELRLLYVGWTRARDRLVLACHHFKEHFTEGMHRHLCDAAGPLLTQPDGPSVIWGQQKLDIVYRSLKVGDSVATSPRAGEGYALPTVALASYAPARAQPSAKAGEGAIQALHTLGERILLTQSGVDAAALGQAMHAFLAADSPTYALDLRQTIARDLLRAWRVDAHIGPESLLESSTRLYTWAHRRWAIKHWLPEVPMHYRDAAGTRVGGRADLVIALQDGGYVVIDHKTFTRTLDEAKASARTYGGQLAAYSAAIQAATGQAVRETFVHVPLAGAMMQFA